MDTDLARIYGVQTKALNQAVKRNADRFPADFVFQLAEKEAREIPRSRSQIATLNEAHAVGSTQLIGAAMDAPNRSQIVTGSHKHRDPRFLPYAFTEHGAIMAATVLNSPQAVQMSLFVVRAFVKMREVLAHNKALADKPAELERKLTTRLDVHAKAIVLVLRELRELLNPSPRPVPPRKAIGFGVRERRACYQVAA